MSNKAIELYIVNPQSRASKNERQESERGGMEIDIRNINLAITLDIYPLK